MLELEILVEQPLGCCDTILRSVGQEDIISILLQNRLTILVDLVEGHPNLPSIIQPPYALLFIDTPHRPVGPSSDVNKWTRRHHMRPSILTCIVPVQPTISTAENTAIECSTRIR